MKTINIFSLFVYLAFSLTVFADENAIDDELKKFNEAAIHSEAENAVDKTSIDNQKKSLINIQSSIANKQYSQALNLIQNHIQLNPGSLRNASELSRVLLAELAKQAELEVERKTKFLKEFSEALIRAKSIEEIDPWLIKLNKEIQRDRKHNLYVQPVWNPTTNFIPNSRGYKEFWTTNSSYQRSIRLPSQLRDEIQTALRIATSWQDYLHALELGDKRSARNHINNVANFSATFVYIPRSKILRLSGDLMPKEEIDQNTTTNMEIKDVQHRLNTVSEAIILYHELNSQSSSRMSSEVRHLQDELRGLKEALDYIHRNNIKYGLERIQALRSSHYLSGLASSILTDYVKSALQLPKDFVIKEDDEDQVWIGDYLNKLAKEKKWSELYRAITITSSIVKQSIKSDANPHKQDAEALMMLMAAENYQKAELYHRAAVAYRQILGEAVGIQAINDEATFQLKKIRKEQPKSYLISLDMYGHDTNNLTKSREGYLKKLIDLEIRKVAEEIQKGKKEEVEGEAE
ncbi:MAG: hypothetical protein ACSHX6_02880 [Akkermansiaceae bacterium]